MSLFPDCVIPGCPNPVAATGEACGDGKESALARRGVGACNLRLVSGWVRKDNTNE